jgi:glucose/arabinose dehydrogenase
MAGRGQPGNIGVAPWGNVLGAPRATPAESLTVLPGFKAELLKSAQIGEGSWICMTVDDRGRLIISPERDQLPLLRITLGADGQVAKTEAMPSPMRAAMGLLCAHGSLYVNGRGPKGVGLYRLSDTNGNDQFEAGEEHLLKNFEGDNEHGYHAVVSGPDKMIYVMNGNHTKVPAGLAPESPYRNYAEDLLLPRQWDANGHAKGVLAPGGYVLKTDPEGKHWDLICGGFRNTYDFDFNTDGELFTFDSDMEWDIGAPWYRPTRINHCVSGGEYGWRSGSGKWPVHYADSLPGNLDIGLSSPTGYGLNLSQFPPKYRKALFACDWNYGKILAVHLQPQGASYTGTFETFLSGKPLAVTSLLFGPDGAMYFIIGGWKMQSGLYRVTYVGPPQQEPPPTAAELAAAKKASEQRAIRHKLEWFHGKKNPQAVEFAWRYLDSEDRWLRFAARVAIESQDLSRWQQRALDETRINASINALLALARRGDREVQHALLESLGRLAARNLNEAQGLEALRVLELCFIRMGKPNPETAAEVVKILSRFYPAKTENLNRELCQLLVFLDAPDVLTNTLALMADAATQEEQMHYALSCAT